MTIMESLLDLEHSGEINNELGTFTSDRYMYNKKFIYELAKIVDKCYNEVKDSDSILKLNMFNTYLLISVPIEENNNLFSLGISELIIKFFSNGLELNDNLEGNSLYRFLIGEGIVNYKLNTIYASNLIFKYMDYSIGGLISSNINITKCEEDEIYIYDKPGLLYILDCSDIIIHTSLDYALLQKHNLSNIKNVVLHLGIYSSIQSRAICTKIKEYIIDANNYFSHNCLFNVVVRVKDDEMFIPTSLYDLKMLLENAIKDIDVIVSNDMTLRARTYITKK